MSMNNYEYQDIEAATEHIAIRRNRYISVLTALICLAIISVLIVVNNNSTLNYNIANDRNSKNMNFFEETIIPETPIPTRTPTSPPTDKPSPKPTEVPTPFPISPTNFPTKAPRNHPTHPPTKNPRPNPTQQPTKTPHGVPSKKPTDWSNSYHPTLTPVFVPTTPPTKAPVYERTNKPTKTPRFPPTHAPQPTRTPTTYSCVESFTNDFNKDILNFYVENPTGTASYTTVHGTYNTGAGFNFPVWCMDYFTPISANYVYNETTVLTWTDVTSNPALAPTIISALNLNQIAWIVNQHFLGTTAVGPQTLDSFTYTGCSSITVSDIQAAFWYLINYGQCTITDTEIHCEESLYITEHSQCNIAYIVNSALAAVPIGSTYVVPDSCDASQIYVPVIILSEGNQPLLVATPISNWKYQCECP
uniref:Uncharacterized protein n=1 Tax=Chromulina nebulosa TaxID=96789 RepID=A0A7S0XHT6_9STRA|mmetsp:Transcript_4975/g.4464  ORF Transcript_4975/g.4464 Transcript_4975/m.4464 type:complete len:418 (+) Transcript_4975:47-1300(+)